MINFRKVTSIALVLCLLFVFSSQSFAASSKDSSTATIAQNNPIPINKANVENALNQLVKDKLITKDYAAKVMAVIEKNTSSSTNTGAIKRSYYNPSTGAVIMYIPTTPNHGQIMFNKEGWNIIKEIINIGGGATTVGFAVAALCGTPVTAPIAALIGGSLVIANAAVNLQFALGNEYAVIPL